MRQILPVERGEAKWHWAVTESEGIPQRNLHASLVAFALDFAEVGGSRAGAAPQEGERLAGIDECLKFSTLPRISWPIAPIHGERHLPQEISNEHMSPVKIRYSPKATVVRRIKMGENELKDGLLHQRKSFPRKRGSNPAMPSGLIVAPNYQPAIQILHAFS